jgi:hypothetical protein
MSVWTWVLIGLCAAGVLLALVSAVPVVRLALRLRERVKNLQNAQLFTSMEALELQRKRLEHAAREAAPLVKRAQATAEQLRAGAADSQYAQMRASLENAGAEITALFEALR